MAPSPARNSAVSPWLHGCLVFLHRDFPLRSPPSRPIGPSPHSQQQTLPWDCSPIPMLLVPATVCTVGYTSQSRALGLWHGLSMCFSLHSDCHKSMTLLHSPITSNAFPLSQTIPPMEGSHLYFSSSTPQSHSLSSAVFLSSSSFCPCCVGVDSKSCH